MWQCFFQLHNGQPPDSRAWLLRAELVLVVAGWRQCLEPSRLPVAFSLNRTVKSTDNLTSFVKKLRDHRDSRESRQEWRLVFLAPVALPYGEVKNFS